MRKTIVLCAVAFLLIAGSAWAGKDPVPTVPDYDVVSFSCPLEVRVNEPLVVSVEIIKYGTGDPGAELMIGQDDGCGGVVPLVQEFVYDPTDKGQQRSTIYSYNLGSYPAISAGLWVGLELYLWDADPDYDFATCQVHVVP